jgi:Protein of unknown function (DUF2958)
MKLVTQELERLFDKYKQHNIESSAENVIVVAKYFLPGTAATWFATEYDPATGIFFGFVTGLAFDEWGSFSRQELEEPIPVPFEIIRDGERLKGKYPMKVERDLYFDPQPFPEAVKNYTQT